MADQQRYYEEKLAYEIDSWDLHVTLEAGEPDTVVDTRLRLGALPAGGERSPTE